MTRKSLVSFSHDTEPLHYHEGYLIIEIAENSNLAMTTACQVTAMVACLAKGFFF